jgi:hypothetical protein
METDCFWKRMMQSVKIDEIYKLAANALSIDMNSLSLQIQKNAA